LQQPKISNRCSGEVYTVLYVYARLRQSNGVLCP